MRAFSPYFPCLLVAGALACGGVAAQSVSVGAANGSAAPGAAATVDILYTFTGGFEPLSIDLFVDYDSSKLTWNQAASTVSYGGSSNSLDGAVAALNLGGDSVLVSNNPGGFAISAVLISAPALTGTVALHAAFTLSPGMAAGDTTALHVYGSVGDNTTGNDLPYDLSPTVTAVVPEPSAMWLMAAGLAGLAVRARRRATA